MGIHNVYRQVPIDKIIVQRDDRQRKEIDISDLLPSISRNGIRSPLLLEKIPDSDQFLLIFGERRFTAAKELKFETVPARLSSDLDPIERKIIELEENLHRKDLPWKDFVSAIQQIHTLYLTQDPDWTQQQTAETVSLEKQSISRLLRVAADLNDPRVQACTGWGPAYNLLARRDDRAVDDIFNSLMEETPSEAEPEPELESGVEPRPLPEVGRIFKSPIVQGSFFDWTISYSGSPFTLIHCDFPYGISHHKSDQGKSAQWGAYSDDPDIYWDLLHLLKINFNKLFAPKSHLFFWLSADILIQKETLSFFEKEMPELSFLTKPLVWLKSDGRGIISDPNRGPRHVYETALIASRGDRFIISPVADAYAAPSGDAHQSEKPEPVLRHFFRMFVDENCRFLDPTCGAGSSICAAESLGARHTTGIELNTEWAEIAEQRVRKARNLRALEL